MHQDELECEAIEGKSGQGKRRYPFACIRGRLIQTSCSIIVLVFWQRTWRVYKRSFRYF